MMRLPPELAPGEARNLIRRTRHPLIAMHVLWAAMTIVLRALISRLLHAQAWYPSPLRSAMRELGSPLASDMSNSDADMPAVSVSVSRSKLRLAVGELMFEGPTDWARTFADSEQYVSLHRWNWLLRALTDKPDRPDLAWGVALMRSYLATMSALPAGLASESYTVGERISNSFVYARVAGGSWRVLPQDVQMALATMAHHLARHLEYHGPHATGNHPLNNARALYLAGQCLRLPALRNLALLVIKERLAVVQTSDGFLREGSSHYHFLFARWLMELQFAAREFADEEALVLLEQPVKTALVCCWFFLVRSPDASYMLPTIGDVSPDCEPAWLKDLVMSPSALAVCLPPWLSNFGSISGWASLLPPCERTGKCSMVASSIPDLARDGFFSFPNSGWHRLQWGGWTAIWRTEAGGAPVEATHSHQDLCSLVLYRDGREVLIDIGRFDYEASSKAGMYAATHNAHNSVSLDGLGPMLTKRDRFLPRAYRHGEVNMSVREDGEIFRLTLAHDGFMRFADGGVKHSRHFVFSPSSVEIEDVFQGQGRRQIAMQFHWASCVLNAAELRDQFESNDDVRGFRIEMQTSGVEDCSTVFIEAGADGMAGWRYPAYGVKNPCMTQMMSGVLSMPSSVRHVISIQSEA